MVDRYLIYFYLLSFIGYFYECIAMVIWTGKWENRGFLFGPVIPIYGTGALMGTLPFTYFIKDHSPLLVFTIGVFASAILEYIVHYTLEKLFNAYWWDYSKAPLNINGRICLPASIGFGIAGLVIIYVINPYVIPSIMNLNENKVQILAIICTILFSADLTLTISTLSSFMERITALEDYVNEHMDDIVGNITDESRGINTRFYNAVDKMGEKRRNMSDKSIRFIYRQYDELASKIVRFTGNDSQKSNYILNKIKDRIGIIDKDER